MMTVYVTNNWDKPIVDEYAYKAYTFPVNESVEVPVEIARHIFGYGSENKEPFLARLGFAKTKNDIPSGLEILAKFSITESKPVQDRSLSPAIDQVPPPIPLRGVGRKVEKAA
jgi:hypothetical protein